MVGNFHEGFIFTFFANQEPFAKIKTVVVHVQSEQTTFQSILLATICIATNKSVLAIVPLTAEVIQEIKKSAM